MAGSWNLRQLFANDPLANDPQPVLRNAEGPASSETMEVGDFTINTAERTAMLRGRDLGLTPGEFEVLVFLTTHPQRCVTPHTILATNWTSNGLHQAEFLKALLSLRKKLDAVVAGNQYLRTEPWVIYKFDPRSSFAS
jgi:two-component system, OmpR family, KDP operon response regulator KdpE